MNVNMSLGFQVNCECINQNGSHIIGSKVFCPSILGFNPQIIGSLALGADGGHVGVVLGIFLFRVGQGGFLLLP